MNDFTSMVICGELKLNSCDDRTLSLVVTSSITAATFTMSSPARTDSYAEAGMLWWSFRAAGRAQVMWEYTRIRPRYEIRLGVKCKVMQWWQQINPFYHLFRKLNLCFCIQTHLFCEQKECWVMLWMNQTDQSNPHLRPVLCALLFASSRRTPAGFCCTPSTERWGAPPGAASSSTDWWPRYKSQCCHPPTARPLSLETPPNRVTLLQRDRHRQNIDNANAFH